MKHVFVVDNFDSFTYNLVDQVRAEGALTTVVRNDRSSWKRELPSQVTHVLISPGPGTPEQSGISREIIGHYWGKVPILGVCLGHQLLGQMSGGEVVQTSPVHGKSSLLVHDGTGLFAGCRSPMRIGRYHSLCLRACPASYLEVARSHDGVLMAMTHREEPIWGVQFHPESLMTDDGARLLRNFLSL